MILTLAHNIGSHQTQQLADFKLQEKRVDIDETIGFDEKWTSLFLTQIYNFHLVKMVGNVLLL